MIDIESEPKVVHRNLSKDEIEIARCILDDIRAKLISISADDPELLFAFRRKIYKELHYDERSKPRARTRLKRAKYKEQNGICTHCGNQLPDKGLYAVLDRNINFDGYTIENTDLIHSECDQEIQRKRRYK